MTTEATPPNPSSPTFVPGNHQGPQLSTPNRPSAGSTNPLKRTHSDVDPESDRDREEAYSVAKTLSARSPITPQNSSPIIPEPPGDIDMDEEDNHGNRGNLPPPTPTPPQKSIINPYILRSLHQQEEKANKTASDLPLTPPPPGGWPTLHGSNSLADWENVNAKQADTITADIEKADPSRRAAALARVFYHGAFPNTSTVPNTIATRVESVIKRHTGEDAIRVVPPNPATSYRGLDRAPFVYFVLFLSQPALVNLTTQGVWSTPDVSFAISDISDPPRTQTYLGSIRNLLVRDKSDLTTLRNNLISTIMQPLYKSIATLSAERQDFTGLEESDRISRILDTVTLDSFMITENGKDIQYVQVYMSPPYDPTRPSDKEWEKLVMAFSKLIFVTTYNGNGEYSNHLTCGLCHSIDHPFRACPFPNIPGWFTPTPIKEADEIREDHRVKMLDRLQRQRGGNSQPNRQPPTPNHGPRNPTRGGYSSERRF